MTRVIFRVLVVCLCASMMGSCGHTNKMQASQEHQVTTNMASAQQPSWLPSTLKELEAMTCPANVKPEVFSLIKTRLRNYLVAGVNNKAISTISQDYTSKIRDLRWEQPSPDGPVYLTWGYTNRGDYRYTETGEDGRFSETCAVGVPTVIPTLDGWSFSPETGTVVLDRYGATVSFKGSSVI